MRSIKHRSLGLAVAALGLCVTLVLVACTNESAEEDAEATPAGTQDIVLTAEDNGSTIAADVGQQIVVRLVSNPTTGYSWEATELDLLEQVGDPLFEPESTDPNIVGAGGTETLTFKATDTGTTTLELVYHRPWEDVEPLETFAVTVTIE